MWKKIIAVRDATFAVAKRKSEKNSGLYDEPLTSAIPVQRSTNWAKQANWEQVVVVELVQLPAPSFPSLLFLTITPRSRSTLVSIIPLSRFLLVSPVWGSVSQTELFKSLERQHCRAARIIFSFLWNMPTADVLATVKWDTLTHQYKLCYSFLPCSRRSDRRAWWSVGSEF